MIILLKYCSESQEWTFYFSWLKLIYNKTKTKLKFHLITILFILHYILYTNRKWQEKWNDLHLFVNLF